jgi:hypothetical protein
MPDPVDPFAPGGALEAAWFLFQELGLPMPPIPSAFAALLSEVDERVYSTRPNAPDSLTSFEGLVAECVRGDAPPYLAFSYEGHGVESWAVRYVAVLPHVAVLLELPFGGAYADADADRAVITRRFAEAARLLSASPSEDQPPLVGTVRGAAAAWREPGADAWTADPDALSTLAARLER